MNTVVHFDPTLRRRSRRRSITQQNIAALSDRAPDGDDPVITRSVELIDPRRSHNKISLESYRGIFEAALDPMILLDGAAGAILDANPSMLQLLGTTHREVVGHKLSDMGVCAGDASIRDIVRRIKMAGSTRCEGVTTTVRG